MSTLATNAAETTTTDILVIGAGPYGLALGAHLSQRGLDHLVVGEPMSFWRSQMPRGMYLRSATDWHLDPDNHATIERYLGEQGIGPADVEPLSLKTYLGYTDWFLGPERISPRPERIIRLDRDTGTGTFNATCQSGTGISARRVVIALGFGAFEHTPPELACLLPPGSWGHTCDETDLDQYAGRRVLIVGGRQSAYEWAALLKDSGAAGVHISHRHPAPAFQEADWSWVSPLVDALVDDPGWYRRSTPDEQQDIIDRMFAEGRLKIEPWLEPRVRVPGVTIHAGTRIVGAIAHDGSVLVTLDDGTTMMVDRIILATGYKVDIHRLPLLAAGNLLPDLCTADGYPVLDEDFGTSVPGLSITSMPATRDFGPFFGFTIAVRASARIIGRALASGAN